MMEANELVLVRWGQKPGNDYIALFNRYRVQIERMKSASEKKKLHNKNRQFHHDLEKITLLCTGRLIENQERKVKSTGI